MKTIIRNKIVSKNKKFIEKNIFKKKSLRKRTSFFKNDF